MKKLLFTLVFSVLFFTLSAQDYEIVSVESLPADFSAREEMKTDHSGHQCALIRIATQKISPDQREGFTFKTDLGSELVERASRVGEIWLWVSPGLKNLRIMHPDLGQYELHLINHVAKVEALRTYKITIKGMLSLTEQERVNNTTTQQYLVFQLNPANATLEVDDQLWSVGTDGTAMKYVNFGTYTYRVRASDHFTETGEVTVDDPDNTHTVTVTLKPNFATISLNVDADAEIWVNNVEKGVRSWTGPLGSGTYKIECKMVGHETTTITKEITTDMNGQTFTLPAPTPIYGSLNVESTPIGATIYIDGKDMGKTPRSINEILVGQHKIKLTKEGYEDCFETINILKGERKQVKVTLKEGTKDKGTFTVNGVSFTMKLVEGGTFKMGATSEQGGDADSDESPVHSVTLSSYWMGETEVTQALWQAVMGSNPSNWKGDNFPVEKVSWNDCQEFICKLNQKTGMNFRLPTEAEWEFAARGGKSSGYKYAGSNAIGDVAWCYDNSKSKPHSVKTKSPNELGLYDMTGNVWEWCQDWYGSYSSGPQTNPTGPSTGTDRILRGGGWRSDSRGCRVSARDINTPDFRYYSNGFRLCLPQ